MAAKYKILNSQDGQAIFELIIFLPFLVYFATILVTSGNAINGSINQQKATRGYFFYITKGNSNLPIGSDLAALGALGIGSVSVYSIGWADKRENDDRDNYGTCYEFSRLYSTTTETCAGKREEPDKSVFVKPLTFFGLCSATYALQVDGSYWMDLKDAAAVNCTLPGS